MIPRYKTLNLELKNTKMLVSGLEESIKKHEKVVEEKDQQIQSRDQTIKTLQDQIKALQNQSIALGKANSTENNKAIANANK